MRAEYMTEKNNFPIYQTTLIKDERFANLFKKTEEKKA